MNNDETHLRAREQLFLAIGKLDGISQVEKLIETKLISEAPLLQEISTYLFALGGKRMRPVLTLMVGKLFGLMRAPLPLIQVASGIELIHMATLLHDDIIDKSPLRRHKESPFLKYGVDSTLLAGDFLLTRAFSLCAHLDEQIVNATESACIALTEGEILEIPLWRTRLTREEYITVARKKTASLFSLAAYSGSHVAQAAESVCGEMCTFGESLGIAFQIIDDILDVTAEENLLGKKSGMDLHERKPSIVNILWLDSGDPRATFLLDAPTEAEDALIANSLRYLRSSSHIQEATALAVTYAESASSALTRALQMHVGIHDQEALSALRALINYTVSRIG